MSSEKNVTVIGADTNQRSASPNQAAGVNTADKKPAEEPKPKRFQNGWTKEQERLMAEWCDIAICYRWLHDRSDKVFHVKTLSISLPVIFLSTISGFANVGIQAILNSESQKTYASFCIAGVSLLAGLLTTVGDRLRYAQLEEAHRVAAISWGKFQRLISVELALNPNDRMDSLDFLKVCRAELDRLIEQSPAIPKESIASFESKFGKIKELKKPDVCDALEHTQVFESSESRLKQMAVEASLMLRRKRQTLNELVAPEVERRIKQEVEQRVVEAIEDRKQMLQDELERKRFEEMKTQEALDRAVEDRRKKIQDEIELEKKMLYQGITIPTNTADKVTKINASGSSFESRLNYRRNSNNVSQRRQNTSPSPHRSSGVEVGNQNLMVVPEEKEPNTIISDGDATITIVTRNE